MNKLIGMLLMLVSTGVLAVDDEYYMGTSQLENINGFMNEIVKNCNEEVERLEIPNVIFSLNDSELVNNNEVVPTTSFLPVIKLTQKHAVCTATHQKGKKHLYRIKIATIG